MAKKDYSGSENIDREKKDAGNDRLQSGGNNNYTGQSEKEKTEVKNAHASGDGSFGRTEGSLPDIEEEEKEKGNSNY